jgi:hypothetical protein
VLKVFLFLSLGYFQIWLNILLCHLSNITKLKFFQFFDKIIGKIMGKVFFFLVVIQLILLFWRKIYTKNLKKKALQIINVLQPEDQKKKPVQQQI